MHSRGKLIMLSGPSCVGKGPLCQALENFHPELAHKLNKLVLFNSRNPRPGEAEGVDYYFRSRESMKTMAQKERFILLEVRGDLQGLDLDELNGVLNDGKNILFEGNPYVPQAIWSLPEMAGVEMLKIFLSPLSREEIIWLKDRSANLYEILRDIMRRKLLRRTRKQKGILSLPDLENIEKRAGSAPLELQLAWQFDWVIPNHDGEDSDHWNAFYYPVGDALKSMQTLAALLLGGQTSGAERWEHALWPDR